MTEFTLYFNAGTGLLGENKGVSYLQQFYEAGIGTDYDIFSMNDYKFGLRAAGGYVVDFKSEITEYDDHAFVRGGVMFTMPINNVSSV